MASLTTTSFSFGFRLFPSTQSIRSSHCQSTVHLPSTKKFSLKLLTSSHSISGSFSLNANRAFSLPSLHQRPQSFTVHCAKGYKMKTHKASAKRFRVTGTGKIMRRRAGKQHLLAKKNTKRRKRLSKSIQVDRSDYNNVIGALPYLKVNRKN